MEEWVRKYRKKGTQVVRIGKNYYLYKVRSVWNPEKKRAQKITEKYLGRITPDGLIKPKHERVLEGLKSITVKEYGASAVTLSLCADIVELLKAHFPQEWKEVVVFALARLFHSSPLKNVHSYYVSSEVSDAIAGASVSPRSMSRVLYSLGQRRGKLVEFLKNFVRGSDFAIIDLTHIFSFSEGVISATLGYNSKRQYVPQLNLVLIYSLTERSPSFYRLVAGSIRDISTLPLTVKEAGLEKAVLIGDKGFYSRRNVRYLEKEGLDYIVPLRRNSTLIDYRPLQGSKKGLGGYFLFNRGVIWYYEKETEEGRRVLVFLDERLRAEEEKDFIRHVEEGRLRLDEYHRKEYTLGTIGVLTRTSFSAQKVYELLKSRVEIELLFDTFKNILHADRTYLRDDVQIEGWMFVNFISLVMYYRFYERLIQKGLLKKFSVKDVIMHLSRVYKIRVGDKWILAELPKHSRTLIEKLDLHLPIT